MIQFFNEPMSRCADASIHRFSGTLLSAPLVRENERPPPVRLPFF
jgi:hypothetical protein